MLKAGQMLTALDAIGLNHDVALLAGHGDWIGSKKEENDGLNARVSLIAATQRRDPQTHAYSPSLCRRRSPRGPTSRRRSQCSAAPRR